MDDVDVVLHAPHVGWHSLHNHLLPLFTRIDSGTTFVDIFANLLAQDECNDIPQPQHELNNSAVPVGPFEAVPRHSIQMLFLLVCEKQQQNGKKITKKIQKESIQNLEIQINLWERTHPIDINIKFQNSNSSQSNSMKMLIFCWKIDIFKVSYNTLEFSCFEICHSNSCIDFFNLCFVAKSNKKKSKQRTKKKQKNFWLEEGKNERKLHY